jgi:hypothetical protein
MRLRTRRPVVVAVLSAVGIAVASAALAGPPLLCHPFQIGSERSLPWDGRTSWFEGAPGYSLATLVAETESLLRPGTPVIVRMETLRRAAIYASADHAVASDLLARLRARSEGQPPDAQALAYLDLAYVVGAFDQLSMLDRSSSPFSGRTAHLRPLVAGLDAYTLVKKSLQGRPGDPSLEFAAALIAADKNRPAYGEHARRARAGALSDPLLARNIEHVSN